MPDLIEDELKRVKQFRNDGKYAEGLDLIEKIEGRTALTEEDRLSCMIFKGTILGFTKKFPEAIELGKEAYELSQKLGNKEAIIDSLFLTALILYQGQIEKSFKIFAHIENLLKTVNNATSKENYLRYWVLNQNKYWGTVFQGDYVKSFEYGNKALKFAKLTRMNSALAHTFNIMGQIFYSTDTDKSLMYFNQALAIWEEAKNLREFSATITQLGNLYFTIGEFDQSLKYLARSSTIKETPKMTLITNYSTMGTIYSEKGELDQGLDYLRKALALGENTPNRYEYANNLIRIGNILRLQGDFNGSIKNLEQSLEVAEEFKFPIFIGLSIFELLNIYLERKDEIKTQFYLNRLKQNVGQRGDVYNIPYYNLGKALTLKTSKRISDIGEAEKILKRFIKEFQYLFREYIIALTLLSEILLEELQMTNNLEVLYEINLLIDKLQVIAEKQHSYRLLAEINLLRAKLALIQNKTDDAQRLLSEAQRTADWHGLNYLAHKISSEHDKLLEQLDMWEKLNKTNAPMSERIKLASLDSVMERLHEKRAVEPSELIKEEPITLMIMDKTGASYFNHPFLEGWDHDDLFSSFLSAFNTFSDEMFSKSIDRIKIGENTILINPIEPFMVCYVIKGQSYQAIQKLDNFTETIKNNSEIWGALNNSVVTSEVLSLSRPSSLGSVVKEIFM